MIDVELLTRTGCKLCDEMKEALTRAARDLPVALDIRLTEIDIDADEELAANYGHDIPVLFVNGSKAFKHRATVQDLKKRLLMADG